MWVFGYTYITITYDDDATIEEINAFINELKEHQELNIQEIYPAEEFRLSSMRLQNLAYQENIVDDILKKHKCVVEAVGNTFVESDCSLYYTRDKE